MKYLAGYQTPENKRYYAHWGGDDITWKEGRENAQRFITRKTAERIADEKAAKVDGYSFIVEVEN